LLGRELEDCIGRSGIDRRLLRSSRGLIGIDRASRRRKHDLANSTTGGGIHDCEQWQQRHLNFSRRVKQIKCRMSRRSGMKYHIRASTRIFQNRLNADVSDHSRYQWLRVVIFAMEVSRDRDDAMAHFTKLLNQGSPQETAGT